MNSSLHGAHSSRRVIKLGGSLLTKAGIFDRLTAWMAAQSPAVNAMLVGGGKAADWWRLLDRQHGLDPELTHALAIATMTDNARVAVKQIAEAIWVESIRDPRLATAPVLAVFNATQVLGELEQTVSRSRLPRSWDVSADSIAVWIALAWQADELVLLKACDPPSDRSTWVAQEYVDPYFQTLDYPIERLRCFNLATQG